MTRLGESGSFAECSMSGQGRMCPSRGPKLQGGELEAVGGFGSALWTFTERQRQDIEDAGQTRDAPAWMQRYQRTFRPRE